MRMTKPMADGSKILDSEKYLDCHKMGRQLINYRSHGFYLKKRKRESDDKSLSDNHHEVGDDVFMLDQKMSDFVQLVEDCSKEIDRASNFTQNIVKRLNPKAGTFDKMVAFRLLQHCETSHEGMKKVFAEMGEEFRMFSVSEDGSTMLRPNAKRWKINLHVDGLSARNFRKLPFNLT